MIEASSVFEAVDARMGGPFKWSDEDCFTSCANVFNDLFDIDLASEVRGNYASEDGAHRILSQYGGSLSVFLEVQAARRGLTMVEGHHPAPVGAIGITPKEFGIGLDGRCVCLHVANGLWATKSLRGFNLSAKAEKFWHV